MTHIRKEDIRAVNSSKEQRPHREVAKWYSNYLLSPEWQERRAKAYALAITGCDICHASQKLIVHHKTYERVTQERESDLQVLCNYCHGIVHYHILIPFAERIYDEDFDISTISKRP